MAGLLILFALIAWIVFCFKVSAAVSGATNSRFAKAPVAIAMFAALLVAPIADDLLGTWQYKRYCKAGDKIAYSGTISVTPDVGLFTANGDWQLASLGPSEHAERSRLHKVAESFVRWDHGTSSPTGSVFPIQERKIEIHDASSGKLLAEWKSYHFKGGFLRRGLFDSASQCFPRDFHSDLYKRLFVLARA
jgi:hypothetical protein